MARLFTTLRWLRPYKSDSGHQVFIRVRIRNGIETDIPVYDYVNHQKLPISVKKEHWNKGHVTGGKYHIPIRDLNSLLSKVENDVKDAVNELIEKNIQIKRDSIIKLTYINEVNAKMNEQNIKSGKTIVDEQGGAFASHDEFVDYVSESEDPKFDNLKKSMGLYEKKYILDYWDEFVRDYAPNSYNAPKHAILEYIESTGDNCIATEFSSEWLQRFFEHIIKHGYSWRADGKDRKDFTISTIDKYDKHLKSFGDYLFKELELLDNQEYRRFSLKKSSKKKSLVKYTPEPYINTHALYKREFDFFYAYNFEDEQLGMVRDMFVLQTWLGGLRQCDFFKISEINFHKDSNGAYKVWFEQQKTDGEVLNVVNQNYLVPLFEKYSTSLSGFPKVHIYNKLLKKAAKKAGLIRKLPFRYEYAKDNDATIKWIPIHEKIANEWARNCAVSILAELGNPDDRISKFTGHKDLQMIKHYKQIHQKEITTMMAEVKPEIVKEL
jgi:integrase